jgi:hypothetical protein
MSQKSVMSAITTQPHPGPRPPNSPGRPLHPRSAVPDDLGALFISSGASRFASLPAKGQRMKPRRKPSTRVAPPPGPMTFYEVARHGTLADPTVRAPRVRADVHQHIKTALKPLDGVFLLGQASQATS